MARTYGELVKFEDHWWLRCEPQVRMRAKRVFPKVSDQTTIVKLADNLTNCRELAWFIDRFPMLISPGDKLYLETRAKEHRRITDQIGSILSGEYQPRDFELALPPRNYQRQAAELCMTTGGLLVADELGLGKTVTGICLLADSKNLPALVVCPTHLPGQWKKELERFLPGIEVHIAKKGTPYRIKRSKGRQWELFERKGLPDVLIVNWHKLKGWADELEGKVKTIIFDEAHELRRNESSKYSAAKQVADTARVKMGLTGTPVFNYGPDIFNILDVINPGVVGERGEFYQEWVSNDIVKEPKALGSHLREVGVMVRRTRSDVGRELPPLTIVPHMIDADPAAIKKVEGSAAELARIILAQGGRGIDKLRASEELSWKLRQATGIAKAPFVAEFVRLLLESEQKILLGGWHREVHSIWQEQLKQFDHVLYTGSESPAQKQESFDRFLKDPNCRIMMMSLRSGQGIDGLQAVCRTAVFGELDWSPAVHEQFIGRLLRDQQTQPVVAYYLTADAGSDPVVADVLGLKAMQADGIRDPDADVIDKGQVDPERIKRLAEDYLRQLRKKVGIGLVPDDAGLDQVPTADIQSSSNQEGLPS